MEFKSTCGEKARWTTQRCVRLLLILMAMLALTTIYSWAFMPDKPPDSPGVRAAGLAPKPQERSRDTTAVAAAEPYQNFEAKGAKAKQRQVIIQSYMRSGSTFTGDLLQAHPGMFYFYEPLWYLYDHGKAGRGFWPDTELRNRTKKYFTPLSPEPIPQPEYLERLFHCQLTPETLSFLTWIRKSHVFPRNVCAHSKTYGTIQPTRLQNCSRVVQPRCENAKALLMKVLRLTMNEMDRYLETNNEVKVIYLVRDPRGIMVSRGRTGARMNTVAFLCVRMKNDLKVSKTLVNKHKGRILVVRYEDLAEFPRHVVKEILAFAGLDMAARVEKTILALTHSSAIETQYGTRRANSSQTSTKWRKKIAFNDMKRIDTECADVYRTLGYKTFKSEKDLRNMSLPQRSYEYDSAYSGVRVGEWLKDSA